MQFFPLLYQDFAMAAENPGNAETVFEQALSRFLVSLSDHEKEDFRLATLQDVHHVIDQIQEAHGSQRKMQNMARLRVFLEAMKQYGIVVEALVDTATVLAFIWV
jgi:hypothetical protein